MWIYLIIEAKDDPARTRKTLLTVDHFKEIERFHQWLDRLEYSIVPGIPRGNPGAGRPGNVFPEYPDQKLRYREKPETVTFHDMCRKERWEFIAEKVWPEGTSEECK